MNAETTRMREAGSRGTPWRRWGPYLSERQWGTVREDYSESGDAWNHFPHDHARSRAYRWGEDGLGGVCDDEQRLCFSVALWNGRDPILKERPFGVTKGEGDHGEDVKDYYFYLDSTPTHSYLRYLYKYPQPEFPYNHRFEHELLDTGIFDGDRYFDVVVEYAKAAPEDLLIQITVTNRGPEEAVLHVLPTLWFRNTWSWETKTIPAVRPRLTRVPGTSAIRAEHPDLGTYHLCSESGATLLFTENETDHERLFGTPRSAPFVKDGIGRHVIEGLNTVNPEQTGTKAAAHHVLSVPGGGASTLRLRLVRADVPPAANVLGSGFSEGMRSRRAEADEFYAALAPPGADEDKLRVLRQSLAGLLWSKQYYCRNRGWFQLAAGDIISMPDKWEFPRFTAWDLAFQAVALATVDVDFAKHQVELLLDDRDVNPPVHAWAAAFIHTLEKRLTGRTDLDFLERVFQKLLFDFTWWVNQKDPDGRNVFQADCSAWMAFYAQCMMQLAIELSERDPVYEDLAAKFAEHFLWISASMDHTGGLKDAMWDEDSGFFYDVLNPPDGTAGRLQVRSLVGLLPLCASTVFLTKDLERAERLTERIRTFAQRHPQLLPSLALAEKTGPNGGRLLSVLDEDKLRRILARMLDEEEFFSPYGIRSLSRHHTDRHNRVWFPMNALIIRALLHLYGYFGDGFTVECPTGSGHRMSLFEVSREISDRLVRIFLRDQESRPGYAGQRKFQDDPHWRDLLVFHEYFHGDNGAGLGAGLGAGHQTGWSALAATFMILYGNLTSSGFAPAGPAAGGG